MKLRRVRVRDFRGLTGTTEVTDLGDGLTVVGGDNEAGKSTWLEALRAALFDRHTLSGKPAEAFLPLGQRVGPEVTVVFECGGEQWSLWKRFFQKPGAELTGPDGERHSGDAAEDRLQTLLGFERPSRGRTGAAHQGVFGLLWLTQGEAHLNPAPAQTARHALGQALESEVGDVLGAGLGQTLLDDLLRERAEYWTRTGRPTGDLRSAEERVARLETEHRTALDALAEYRDSVDRLERIDQERRALDAPDGIAALETRRDQARRAHAELETARQRKARTDNDLRLAEAEAATATNRWQERTRLIAECERANTRLGDGDSEADAQARQFRELETALATEREAEATAVHALETAEARLARLEQRERLTRLHAEEKRLAQALERARAARNGEQEARRAARAIAIGREDVDALRALDDRLVSVRERLAGGATRVRPELNTPYHLSGHAREDADGVEITGDAVLHIEGVGVIRIVPGGEDLAAAEGQKSRIEITRGEQLQRLGVPDTAAAQSALEDRERHENRARESAALLEALAPEGLEALLNAHEDVRSEIHAAGAAEADADADADDREAAQRDVQAARSRLDEARQRRSECEQSLGNLRERIAGDRSRREAQQAERDRIAERLAGARREQDDDTLHNTALTAERQLAAMREQQQAAAASIDALDPERTELYLQRSEAACEQAIAERRNLQKQGDELRARLDALGQSGLSEAAQALEADLGAAQREHDRVRRDAEAVWHAWEALDSAARAARETYVGPLTERLRPYLDLLLPDAAMVFGDTLGPTALHRHGQAEMVEQLSVGTREQLAIITRLAFADLLAERGESTPVVLDDALVFADETRFEAMQLILTRAARRHQIIILTCRPSDFRGLGAPLRRLQTPNAVNDTGVRE